MAYKITQDCISCGACEGECENQAIAEGAEIYVIDFNKCTECVGISESSKCAAVCGVDACVQDPDHVESKEHLLAKWKKLHPGKTPAAK